MALQDPYSSLIATADTRSANITPMVPLQPGAGELIEGYDNNAKAVPINPPDQVAPVSSYESLYAADMANIEKARKTQDQLLALNTAGSLGSLVANELTPGPTDVSPRQIQRPTRESNMADMESKIRRSVGKYRSNISKLRERGVDPAVIKRYEMAGLNSELEALSNLSMQEKQDMARHEQVLLGVDQMNARFASQADSTNAAAEMRDTERKGAVREQTLSGLVGGFADASITQLGLSGQEAQINAVKLALDEGNKTGDYSMYHAFKAQSATGNNKYTTRQTGGTK